VPEPEPEPEPRPRRPLPTPRVSPPRPHTRDELDHVPDPDQATHLLRLAREAMEQTRYGEAARLAAAAATASPFEVDAYLVEGRARATVGDDEGSLVALRKAVYLAPTNGHARFLLAGALARCGEHAAAAREYRAAAQTLPDSSPQDLDDLLDGCDVGELVTLCQRLAAENDLRAAGTAS